MGSMETIVAGVERPSHIPEELVFAEFDLYDMPLTNVVDAQTAYVDLRDRAEKVCGDIFWTPRHGGHWVLTRAQDILAIQRDMVNFTRAPQMIIPPVIREGRGLPIQIDPPEHGAFRRPMTKYLLPQRVEKMSAKVRETVIDLIEGLVDRGECDFVNEFSQQFPILIFLDLVNLPRSDREILLPYAEATCRGVTVEERMEAYAGLYAYLEKVVIDRQANPGDDLFSAMVNVEIDGQKLNMQDALDFCSTVLVAGLDTVAAMLGFVVRHFALHPEHRRELIANLDDDAFMRNAVEELIRRYALANSTRVVKDDMEYRGIKFARHDMILTANTYVGLDDRVVDNPMVVDFSRDASRLHAAFDIGPHTCVGAPLARRELRTFLEEWFRRIPDFSIKPGTTPRMATGMVSSVLALDIVWPARD